MDEEEISLRRVKFFGVRDLSTGWQLPRVVELIEQFDPKEPPTDTQDLLELSNVQKYLAENLFPLDYSDEQRAAALSKLPRIREAIARHFSNVDNNNFRQVCEGVDWQFLDDLLELLGRHGAFERCDSNVALPALGEIGIHIGNMLAHPALVKAYDPDLATLLVSNPANAEIIIRKHLEQSSKDSTRIPPSLSTTQSRALIESYIDSEHANPNFVRLVRDAKTNVSIGLDAKLKLRAKRRYEDMSRKIFEENDPISTGYGVSFSEDQDEPVRSEISTEDGWLIRYSYSVAWLEETLDAPSILNNVQHLFEFADDQVLLNLPSYAHQIGTIEGLFGSKGKDDYVVGNVFRLVDSLTLLRLRAYAEFLESKDIYIEEVIQWFFESYILHEFKAEHFSFTPSDRRASYLSRARHIFAELESVASQFGMFAEEGVLDRDLLSIGGDQVRYKSIASLIPDKYAYPVKDSPISGIMFQLFSDQSYIHYISEDLKADSAVSLLVEHAVSYEDFRPHQLQVVDFLIDKGMLENTGTRVQIANLPMLKILRSFYDREAVSIHHLSNAGQKEVLSMVANGWVTVESTLLTAPEGTYFNYFLNTFEHGNGPKLRNKYLHGTQANGATENEHATAYTYALRLVLALVIKINDDFCLHAETAESLASSAPTQG